MGLGDSISVPDSLFGSGSALYDSDGFLAQKNSRARSHSSAAQFWRSVRIQAQSATPEFVWKAVLLMEKSAKLPALPGDVSSCSLGHRSGVKVRYLRTSFGRDVFAESVGAAPFEVSTL